jgi:hypothetical protein
LPEVWEHVGDKAAFVAFVQTSLREFLGVPRATGATPSNPIRSATSAQPPIPPLPE